MQRNSILRSLLELLSFHLVIRENYFFKHTGLPSYVLVPQAVLRRPDV